MVAAATGGRPAGDAPWGLWANVCVQMTIASVDAIVQFVVFMAAALLRFWFPLNKPVSRLSGQYNAQWREKAGS
jgi:hypothetical protein